MTRWRRWLDTFLGGDGLVERLCAFWSIALLATLLWPGSAFGQESVEERAKEMANMERLTGVAGVRGGFRASEGKKAVLFAPIEGGHLGLRVSDGKRIELPELEEASVVVPTESGRIGVGVGKEILLLSPEGAEKGRWALPDGTDGVHDLAVSPDERFLAWWDRSNYRAGILRAEDGASLGVWEEVEPKRVGVLPMAVRFGRWGGGGTHLILRIGKTKPAVSTFGTLEIHRVDETPPRGVAALGSYPSSRTPGWAVSSESLYFGARIDGDLSIRRWDRKTGKVQVIDDEPRQGHFLDLRVSPDGRWLTEGDFEKEGARIYDLTGEEKPRTVGRGIPIGFDPRSELLFLAGGVTGVEMWDVRTGKRCGEIAALNGRDVRQLQAIETSEGMRICVWSTRHGGIEDTHHVEIYK